MNRPARSGTHGVAIAAVGAVVPARDEQQRVGRCLDALATALAGLPPHLGHVVCLVLDRCRDDTAHQVELAAARHPHLSLDVLVNEQPASIGALRDRGLRRSLRLLHQPDPRRVWLLSTDADSLVEPTWVLDHLRHAHNGAHAVAGVTELDDPRSLGQQRLACYERIVASGTHGRTHNHVYAANLGVRAEAYLQVGGFPDVLSGEDHQLTRRLHTAGHPVVAATDVRVRTSARQFGRASGGLADLLSSLPADEPGAG